MMYDEDFLKDFSKRTFENLKIVCNRKDGKENLGYEVTQLVNSFIGLLIFPQQGLFDEWEQQNIPFPNARLEEIANGKSDSYFEMLRRLRNAVTHKNMKPYPEESTASEVRMVEGFCFLDNNEKFRMHMEVKDVFNVLMHVLALVLGEKDFPWDGAEELAKFFHTELQIDGIR